MASSLQGELKVEKKYFLVGVPKIEIKALRNKLSPLSVSVPSRHLPAQSYITRAKYEICSKLIIKTPEPRHWHCSGVFIVNFEHRPHLALRFLLLTLNM